MEVALEKCCAYHCVGCTAQASAAHEAAAVTQHLALLLTSFVKFKERFENSLIASAPASLACVIPSASLSKPQLQVAGRDPVRATHLLDTAPCVLEDARYCRSDADIAVASKPTCAPGEAMTADRTIHKSDESLATTILTSAPSMVHSARPSKTEEASLCTVDMFLPGRLRSRSEDHDTQAKRCKEEQEIEIGAEKLGQAKVELDSLCLCCTDSSDSKTSHGASAMADASHKIRVESGLAHLSPALEGSKNASVAEHDDAELRAIEMSQQNPKECDMPAQVVTAKMVRASMLLDSGPAGVIANVQVQDGNIEGEQERDINEKPIHGHPQIKREGLPCLLEADVGKMSGGLEHKHSLEPVEKAISHHMQNAGAQPVCLIDADHEIVDIDDCKFTRTALQAHCRYAKDETVSETGQRDLLRLLQGTPAMKDAGRHDTSVPVELAKQICVGSALHSPLSSTKVQPSPRSSPEHHRGRSSQRLATAALGKSAASALVEEISSRLRSPSPKQPAAIREKDAESVERKVAMSVLEHIPPDKNPNHVIDALVVAQQTLDKDVDKPVYIQEPLSAPCMAAPSVPVKQIEMIPTSVEVKSRAETRPQVGDAHAVLSAITIQLQEGRASHAEAEINFGNLIDKLPPGKLRCCALLNRAHCLVALGRNSEALADIGCIVADRETPGAEAISWPKVWMSRGHVLRKMAEAETGVAAANLYARARDDFEQALAINGVHIAKARRCLDQLNEQERRLSFDLAAHVIADQDVGMQPTPQQSHPKTLAKCLTPIQPWRSPEKGPIDAHGDMAMNAPKCSLLVSALPDDIAVEQLWVEFQRFGSIEDVRADPTSAGGRCAVITFANPADAAQALQGAQEALFILGAGPTCKVEMEQGRRPTSASHESLGKRRRLQSRGSDLSLSDASAQFHFAQKGLQALGHECIKAGRALKEECVVRSEAATDKSRIFAIESSAGLSRVTLQLQDAGPGDKIGSCTCWLRGHCKHVAVALLTIIAESSEHNHSGAHKIQSPSDPEARNRRDALELGLRQRSVEEVRTFLRMNNMLLTGTKPVLARRVADGIAFGAIPACPNCGAHLHPCTAMDSPSSMYVCRRVTRSGKHCGYEIDGCQLQRKPCVGVAQFS